MIKVFSDKRIEVVDLEEVENLIMSNFIERQDLAIQSYKTNHDKDEELFKAYLTRLTINSSHLDSRKYPGCVRNVPDRFDDN